MNGLFNKKKKDFRADFRFRFILKKIKSFTSAFICLLFSTFRVHSKVKTLNCDDDGDNYDYHYSHYSRKQCSE